MDLAGTTLEVLSPAGSQESLEAAVRSGADAVYLGGASFSARASAKNFDDQSLREAVEYCHARGVKVHLAVNTLMREEELLPALRFVEYACSLPVDAVLVQDPGLLMLLRRCAPGLPLHASTQMSIHTPAGVAMLERQGLSRVVLSREMSLDEIREARQNTTVELEAFVHGALCMSVSGQCYFSAMLGGRSGNRGMCAQTCRLPFSAPGGTGNDLSLKDLSMLTRVQELADAGVMSMKIEGRMKRPEYVAAATRACRLAVDNHPQPEELLRNLGAVFSRSGFTTGYPDGKLGREMFGVRSKGDVTAATNAVLNSLHTLYKEEAQRVPVIFSLKIQEGQNVSLSARDFDGHESQASAQPPEPARSRPADQQRCTEQLCKTGGTPFFVERVDCQIGEGLSVPVSVLNQLRREVLDKLLELRTHRPAIPFALNVPEIPAHSAKPMKLRARFANGQVPEEAKSCELVYVPYNLSMETLQSLRNQGFRLALELPRGMFGKERAAAKLLEQRKAAGFTQVWAGNLGAAALALELGLQVHGGFSLNAWNTPAAVYFEELGLTDLELSFEVTLAQAGQMGGQMPRGLVLYGRLPMMLTRNCPAANGPGGCKNCKTAPVLTDRMGMDFPVQCAGGCSEILNAVPLYMADRLNEVKNMNFGVLRFTTETPALAAKILAAYRNREAPPFQHTRGLYYRGVE